MNILNADAIPQVVKHRSETGIAVHEVPQILVQGILAYDRDPTLESHTAFVLRIDGSILQVSMAVISHTYMNELCHGRPFSEGFRLCRSVPYDFLERDGRREALRLFTRLFRLLEASKERT